MPQSSPEPHDRRRRRPRQDRGKATVEAILTASAQVLRAEGYSRLTTRAIAERAGVSVGSLYQYFPSKEAVVRALSDQQREHVMAALKDALARTEGRDLAGRTRTLVEALLAAKTEDPELNAKLSTAMLEIDGPCFLSDDTAPFRDIVRATLREIGVKRDLELTSFVIVRAVEGVLSGAATGEQRFDDPRLAEALTKLVLGLLM